MKVKGEGEQRTLKVCAKGLAEGKTHVKAVTFNGRPVTDWKVAHADLMKGGELGFEMK